MNVELYKVKVANFSSVYGYHKEYAERYDIIGKLIKELGLAVTQPPFEPLELQEGAAEKYKSWTLAEDNPDLVLTDKQLVKLAVLKCQFTVEQVIKVELEDISLPFRTIEGKAGEALGNVSNNTYNNRCEVHMPGNMMASYNELMLVEDSCSDVIQTHLSSGWRLVAVCPQPDQRRPDYILGRYNPTKEVSDSAARG